MTVNMRKGLEGTILQMMIEHFKSTVAAGRGAPFEQTGVSLPTAALAGYAHAIASALPSPELPAGGRVDRKAIAKIIDPDAWDRWGKERGGIGFACFNTSREQQAAFAKADEIIAPSLAKADVILAALPAPAPHAEVREALEPLAKISLWRDTYLNGPDILTDRLLRGYFTVEQIRAARRLCDD